MHTHIENKLDKAGLGKLVDEIKTQKPDARLWPSMFMHTWLSSALDEISRQDPEVRGFIGSTHNRYVDDFTRLDEERIGLAADRIKRAHGEHAVAAMNAHTAGELLIRAEAAKMKRHLPLGEDLSTMTSGLVTLCSHRTSRCDPFH